MNYQVLLKMCIALHALVVRERLPSHRRFVRLIPHGLQLLVSHHEEVVDEFVDVLVHRDHARGIWYVHVPVVVEPLFY